jgi:hypothetical protein
VLTNQGNTDVKEKEEEKREVLTFKAIKRKFCT